MSQDSPTLPIRVATLGRLGVLNLARVATYRLLLKAGAYRLLLRQAEPVQGPFFTWPTRGTPRAPANIDRAAWEQLGDRVLRGDLPLYSARWANFGFPPVWNMNYVAGVPFNANHRHWSEIALFSLPGGDVKGYWEPARFDGLILLAQAWIASGGEERFRIGIERWLESWGLHTPANRGVQWACGQETGLRLLHLLAIASLLRRWGEVPSTDAFCELVLQHCSRIAPTMLYAIGQDNNHGTSEAAALFAGGAFLETYAPQSMRTRAQAWKQTGRRWLEERIDHLVMSDGSFAQHSVNYHRLMLDTCSMAEVFRLEFGQPPFSSRFLARCVAALRWLSALTDADSGDAPNLGANDGARIFVLHLRPYRDFRPSVALAGALFERKRICPQPEVNEPLRWLELDTVGIANERVATDMLWKNGGYAKLQRGDTWFLLRLPQYRFRPGQSDALHLDVWRAGHNVLKDAGSYSYNTETRWLDYFGGVAAHNTVQFDDRDQMPRLSRFLFGAWLSPDSIAFDSSTGFVASSYTDYRGARHERRVEIDALGNCRVTDIVSGFERRAVLRWRLSPEHAGELQSHTWHGANMRLRLHSSVGFRRVDVVEGWEAKNYGAMSSLPVIEAEVTAAARITSEILFVT